MMLLIVHRFFQLKDGVLLAVSNLILFSRGNNSLICILVFMSLWQYR